MTVFGVPIITKHGTKSTQHIYKKGNVNECRTALVKNLIKESFYGKRKKKQLMF